MSDIFEPLVGTVKGTLRKELKRQSGALRGAVMAADQLLAGKSVKDLAAEYGLTERTAALEINDAYKRGFANKVQGIIAEKLIGPALAVYEAHLHRGSLEAARDILFGAGILSKNPKTQDEGPTAPDTIDAYRALRSKDVQ